MNQSVITIQAPIVELKTSYADVVGHIHAEFLRLLDELRNEYDNLDLFLTASGTAIKGAFLKDFDDEITEDIDFDALRAYGKTLEGDSNSRQDITLLNAVMALKGAYELLEHAYNNVYHCSGMCELGVFEAAITTYFESNADVIKRAGFHYGIVSSQTDNIMHIARKLMPDYSELKAA